MGLEIKKYNNVKINDYVKKNNMFFVYLLNHFNINKWLSIKQLLKISKFQILLSFKIMIKKIIENSIYSKFKAINNHTLILIYFKRPKLLNFFLNDNLNFLSLKLLAIKLNNQICYKKRFLNNYSLSYACNKFLLFQFNISYIKKISK